MYGMRFEQPVPIDRDTIRAARKIQHDERLRQEAQRNPSNVIKNHLGTFYEGRPDAKDDMGTVETYTDWIFDSLAHGGPKIDTQDLEYSNRDGVIVCIERHSNIGARSPDEFRDKRVGARNALEKRLEEHVTAWQRILESELDAAGSSDPKGFIMEKTIELLP